MKPQPWRISFASLAFVASVMAFNRPQVFVSGTDSGGGSTGSETTGHLNKVCAAVMVTLDREKADYVIIRDDTGAGPGRKPQKLTVFNRRHELIFAGATRSIANSAKDACRVILTDWDRAQKPVTSSEQISQSPGPPTVPNRIWSNGTLLDREAVQRLLASGGLPPSMQPERVYAVQSDKFVYVTELIPSDKGTALLNSSPDILFALVGEKLFILADDEREHEAHVFQTLSRSAVQNAKSTPPYSSDKDVATKSQSPVADAIQASKPEKRLGANPLSNADVLKLKAAGE